MSEHSKAEAKEPRLTLREMQQELTDLCDEAEVLIKIADDEKRDLTEEEKIRLEALMETEIPSKRKAVDGEEKRVNYKHQIVLSRLEDVREQDPEPLIGVKAHKKAPAIPRMASLKAFRDDPSGGLRAEEKAYRCGHWLKAVVCSHPRMRRAEYSEKLLASWGMGVYGTQVEGDNSLGGYLVPEPLAATIVDNRERIGISRQLADMFPMSSEKQDIPKIIGGPTVYSPGEGKAITPSDSTFSRLELIARKRAVATQLSSELADDAVVNMADRAAMEMARALALQEDEEMINGDGSATYFGETGLLTAIGAGGVFTAPSGEDTWADLTPASVSGAMGLLPSQYYEDGMTSIICSSQFYFQVLERLMLAGGGNTISAIQSGSGRREWMGHPVIFTARMPTATAVSTVSMLFGNFRSGVIFGDRSGIRMAISLEYDFLNDLITLLAISRYDILVHEPGDATNAGAYVALKTAAS